MHDETTTTAPRRRALLIGSPVGGLLGVLPDVATMRCELEAWGFECEERTGADATREEILRALHELVAWAQPADAIVIYYSGHGGRGIVVEREGERSGPKLSFLVPWDIDHEGDFRGILEHELAGIVDDLSLRTPNVTVILDCCHSAGMARGTDVPRAVPERRIMTSAQQASLAALDRRPRPLDADGHRGVVRVVATAPGSLAFEFREPGRNGGYLTHELCAALAEARQVPLAWEAILGKVRERVAERRRSTLQRPEVEGPRRRLPFSLDEPAVDGERSTLVYGSDGAPWMRAGRLHGLCKGDTVEIQAGGSIAATGRVVALLDHAARLELDPRADGQRPALGSTVVPRTLALRRTVRVDPGALGVEGVLWGLERSLRLRVVDDDEPADFLVALVDGGLHLSGPPWLRRVPRPTTPEGVDALVADLDALARSEILLAALACPPGLDGGASPIDWEVEVKVTAPDGTEPQPLVRDQVLPEGTLVYAELRHRSLGRPTLYVNVLDRGVSGRLALVNASEPAGVQLRAQEERWVGRRRTGGPLGVALAWPDCVPRGHSGHETLYFVVSQRPLDLRSLLEGPRAERAPRSLGQTRGTPADELETPLAWTVTRVGFGVAGVAG